MIKLPPKSLRGDENAKDSRRWEMGIFIAQQCSAIEKLKGGEWEADTIIAS